MSYYNYNVKFSQPNTYKVTTEIDMSRRLEDLLDVDLSGVSDKYVIMYDSASGKYKAVNPDVIISAAVTEPIQPGLPSDFVNALDVDLDDRINLDAGTFW